MVTFQVTQLMSQNSLLMHHQEIIKSTALHHLKHSTNNFKNKLHIWNTPDTSKDHWLILDEALN